ncbi:MAG: RNA polymerase sigma factor [Planctomycetota bacterium]
MSTTITSRPPRPLPVQPSLSGRPSPARRPRRRVPAADWAALAALRPTVLAFLQARCRDPHQAEDLAHDTLLRAARSRTPLHGVARPSAWALQIAANVQRDHARRESRQQLMPADHTAFAEVIGTEPVPGATRPEVRYDVEGQSIEGDDLMREVREVWCQMLPRDRAILSAYYLEQGGRDEAARACGIRADLVKVRLFRARRRLELAVRARLR